MNYLDGKNEYKRRFMSDEELQNHSAFLSDVTTTIQSVIKENNV